MGTCHAGRMFCIGDTSTENFVCAPGYNYVSTDLGHRPQPLTSDTSLVGSTCRLDTPKLDHILQKIVASDFNVHTAQTWSRPVNYVRMQQMQIRFHRDVADYVKARSFRLRNKIIMEPRRMAMGLPSFPEFFVPYINKRIKVYLYKRAAVKDVVFSEHIAEYAYLLKHVTHLTLRVVYDRSSDTGLTIRIEIQENHRIRKQFATRVQKKGRVMYATHVWVIHGENPILVLKGMEFKLQLMPRLFMDNFTAYDPIVHGPPVAGLYYRSLDSTSYADNILVSWEAELRQPTEEEEEPRRQEEQPALVNVDEEADNPQPDYNNAQAVVPPLTCRSNQQHNIGVQNDGALPESSDSSSESVDDGHPDIILCLARSHSEWNAQSNTSSMTEFEVGNFRPSFSQEQPAIEPGQMRSMRAVRDLMGVQSDHSFNSDDGTAREIALRLSDQTLPPAILRDPVDEAVERRIAHNNDLDPAVEDISNLNAFAVTEHESVRHIDGERGRDCYSPTCSSNSESEDSPHLESAFK